MPLEIRSELQLPKEKKKILFLSDDPRAPSGVGTQARMLIEGLLSTGKYTFRCLGGAMKHENYETVALNPDFIIKPVDGFGTRDQVRNILMTERPDVILIFTDPRQFIWLWEVEDEVHQLCPIAYWHVWDNDPYPAFNKVWYDSTDLINCLSYKTYEMVKPNFPEKTNYIPHAFPKEIYFPINKEQVKELRKQNLGERAEWFWPLWVNRNATRKMPSDVLEGWKLFLDKLEKKHGHRNACMMMHTDPQDMEGPNLLAVSDLLKLQGNVMFSNQKLENSQMNILHNMTDCCVNIARNEGFGLSSLISLQCGKPVINLKTGGLTRQVLDYRNGNELGVAIEPVTRKLVGSQMVPYIYEDFTSQEDLANAFMKIYELTEEEKEKLKEQALDYVNHEFSFEKMIKDWDATLENLLSTWSIDSYKRWDLLPLDPDPLPPPKKLSEVNKNPFKKITPSVLGTIGKKK